MSPTQVEPLRGIDRMSTEGCLGFSRRAMDLLRSPLLAQGTGDSEWFALPSMCMCVPPVWPGLPVPVPNTSAAPKRHEDLVGHLIGGARVRQGERVSAW